MPERVRPFLSASQRRVLEWLYWYPGVELNASPGLRIIWTAMWASEEARRDLERTMPELLGTSGVWTRPRDNRPLAGGTPRCAWGTFVALQRRQLLRPTGRNRGELPRYWQISSNGVTQLEHDLRLDLPREPRWPGRMYWCECGWCGRGIGGHRRSGRHLLFLIESERLAEYRARVLAENEQTQNRQNG